MKRIIAKYYFDKAKQMYPNEKNKTRLMDIAEILKMTMNSHCGKAQVKVSCNGRVLLAKSLPEIKCFL